MRLLEEIQQHLDRWWRKFHEGNLPTPSHLDTLLSELCDVAKDLPTELGCPRDLGFCDEDEEMEVDLGCPRDHPGTTRGRLEVLRALIVISRVIGFDHQVDHAVDYVVGVGGVSGSDRVRVGGIAR